MAEILRGAPVAEKLKSAAAKKIRKLTEKGHIPKLVVLRTGEKSNDLSYENSLKKNCEKLGIVFESLVMPPDVSEEELISAIKSVNEDPSADGLLMFCPLPRGINEDRVRNTIAPEKDVDGATDASLAGVFEGKTLGFSPCTAQAVMEILDYYGIDPAGKRAVVMGRSLVVGRPLSMLLLGRNATVTICHSGTKDIRNITKEAELLVTATGRPESVNAGFLGKDQILLDVGTGWSETKGKLCGDLLFDEAEPLAAAITPVPGGVGTVTTAVLLSHVVQAAAAKLPGEAKE